MNENDIQHTLKSDANLREAIGRREQQLPPMPADLNERVMERMEDQPQQRRNLFKWMAAAASFLLVIGIGAMLLTRNPRPKEKSVAVKTIPGKSESSGSTDLSNSTALSDQSQHMDTETMDSQQVISHIDANAAHVVATSSKGNGMSQKEQPALPSTVTSDDIDSLQYYIDKIEKELAVVDDSLYIDRMNKVISADERLQRIVNSYIQHTLDEENRPQTAENMSNVKKQEDENK